MSLAKRAIAAKKLNDAWLYVASTRKLSESGVDDSLDILMECERFVRNGFRMDAKQHFAQLRAHYGNS